MVKVECDGCKAPYQIDEKRIPATGLKMRCPKCGTNILVTKPGAGGGAGEQDLPAVAPAKAGPPGAPPRPAPPKGPPPVPPRAAPKPASDMEATRSGFGEIDLAVDLPAADVGDDTDLPAVRAAAPVGFGDVDLPSVHPGGAPDVTDLPALPGGGFGELDLPMAPAPAAPPPPARPRARTVNFGDIDLPMAPPAAAPPPPPGPPPPPRQRGRTVNFGDIDLPSVPDGIDLPQPARGGGGFGELDLPLVADDGGLPMAAHGHAGLPMPAAGAGLPMPAAGAGLPMAAATGLPMAAYGHTGLPMAADVGLPAPMDSLPAAAPYSGAPNIGDEISIGGGRSNAFDDSDRAMPSQMDESAAPMGSVGIDIDGPARAAVGDEADLSADIALAPGATAEPGAQRQRPPREAEAPQKRGTIGKVGIAAAVAFMLVGGAMSLVPSIGPFGFNLVSDQINAGSNAAAVDALKKSAGAQFDEDTSGAVNAALDKCKQLVPSMPRFTPAKAYCAYIAAERGLRFGNRKEDEAYARQLLKEGGVEGGPAAALAQAALDALAGQAAKGRTAAMGAAQRAPNDVDAAVTLANIELAMKSGAAAVTAWKQAVALKKSARTLYGLARAQAAVGNDKDAVENGKAAIAASPKHAGARILVASLTWSEAGKEDAAVAMLKEIIDQGKAAGEAELVEASTQLGRIHLAKSRITAAEQAFAAALKIDPLYVPALVGNAELFYRSGRYSEALSRFEAASKADESNVLAKVGMAKTMLSMERMKEAKDMLKKQRETTPGEALVVLWLGRADVLLNNKKDAEAEFIEAIKLGGNKPEVVEAYVSLANLLATVGRTEDANAKLAEASKKFPDSPALHRAKGEVANALGRFEEAKTELEAALAKEEDLGARFRLGVVLRRMRKFEDAGAVFDKVASVDKDYPGLALERGLLFMETGQAEKALESYRLALQKAPNDVDLKLRVGSTQVIAGQVKEAIKLLEEVRKERPNSAEANHFLGRALLLRGSNLVEAVRYLDAAVRLDSNRAEYQLYVGWAANEQNDAAKATAALNKALELDHELGEAYWQRGVLLQKQGTTQDALKDLQTALAKRPSLYEAWATIALCLQDLQRWPDAEKAWREAIKGNDSRHEWHFRLGKQLASHGNPNGAIPELEKAVELAEAPDASPVSWLYDAHFLLGEAYKGRAADKQKAIDHYKKFLDLAPRDHAYRSEVTKALAGLGEK